MRFRCELENSNARQDNTAKYVRYVYEGGRTGCSFLFVCVYVRVRVCVCVYGFACVCLAYVSKYKQTENTYGKINAHINKKDIVRKTRCARMFIYGLSTPPACDTPSPPRYAPYYRFYHCSSYSPASAAA